LSFFYHRREDAEGSLRPRRFPTQTMNATSNRWEAGRCTFILFQFYTLNKSTEHQRRHRTLPFRMATPAICSFFFFFSPGLSLEVRSSR
jgi:hypothetical protein